MSSKQPISHVILVLTGVSFGTVEPAMATPITFVAQGTVDFVSSPLLGTFSLDDNFTVVFTFESLTPDSNPSPDRGEYLNAITALSVTVGKYSATATGDNIITIFNDLGGADEYRIDLLDPMVGPSVRGVFDPSTQAPVLQLRDPTATAFTTDALPATPPNPADFVSGGTFLALEFVDPTAKPPFNLAFVLANVSLIELVENAPEDTNGDGAIDVLDLIDVLLCFGLPAVPDCEDEDINQDGIVNVLDLIDVLLAFGTFCCAQLDCDDGDPCTIDTCDPVLGCSNTPIIPCCGNGVAEAGEDCSTCPQDVPCPPGQECVGGVCELLDKDVCKGAEVITLPAAPHAPDLLSSGGNNTTVGATIDPTPLLCLDQIALGNPPVEILAPGNWYSVIGNGSTLTATTCNERIGYDSAISVFCGPCTALSCVGANIDGGFDCIDLGAPFPDGSIVTWCSAVGVEYLILVHGEMAVSVGPYRLDIISDGIVCLDPAKCVLPPINICHGRIPILDGPTAYDTTGATTDGPAHVACQFDGQTYHDIWYNYTATCSGTLTVTTCEDLGGSADYDTDLVVYDGCECGVGLEDPPLGCNDDDQVNACGDDPDFHSTVEVLVVAGNCYKIRVGGFDAGDFGAGTLSVSCVP